MIENFNIDCAIKYLYPKACTNCITAGTSDDQFNSIEWLDDMATAHPDSFENPSVKPTLPELETAWYDYLLASAKERKKTEINVLKDSKKNSGITYDSIPYQSDKDSYLAIVGLATDGTVTANFIDANNTKQSLSETDFNAMRILIRDLYTNATIRAKTLKDSVDVATTVAILEDPEDPNYIDITAGW